MLQRPDRQERELIKVCRSIVFEGLDCKLEEPVDYDYLCNKMIAELVKHEPKWRQMTMPYRLLKYPPYECVYKSLHNVINRRLKEINK